MKLLVRMLLLWLVRLWGLWGAYRAQQRLQRPLSAQPRILLIRPDHLGDLVLTTPVVQALREQLPQAQITMMVGPWSREVVERHPGLDCVITCAFPGFQRAAQKPLEPYRLLFKTAREIHRAGYDLAINLRPDFWWGAALIYLARIPRRCGYAIEPGTVFLTKALAFPAREHGTVSNLRLVSAGLTTLGMPGLEEPYTAERYPLVFRPTADEQRWMQERLQSAGIEAETSVVVIHPGTGGAVKLWRSEGWSSIAEEVKSSGLLETPVQIVLTGSPKERALLDKVAGGMQSLPLCITDATVGQLAALLGRARLVLGVDNGPLHLATAQDTPTVRLFGPTDTHVFGPWGNPERHRVLASQQRCASCPAIPCGRLDFSPEELSAHPCVRLLTEEQVAQEITWLLKHTTE